MAEIYNLNSFLNAEILDILSRTEAFDDEIEVTGHDLHRTENDEKENLLHRMTGYAEPSEMF